MVKELNAITLEIPQGTQSFPMEQADALLRMKFNGGWRLPEDSEWTWSVDRGFEKKSKSVKGSMGGAKTQGSQE